MTPEEIARQNDTLPGYELIDYSRVAFPVYKLTVDAVTMAHNELQPIREFVMRCIENGLTVEDDIAGFLGLDQAMVSSTVQRLQFEKFLSIDESGLVLTEHGRTTLEKAIESSPQDEMLVFLYDRLLRIPVRYDLDDLVTPAAIDSRQIIEIRPYPAEGPEVNELQLPETTQVLEKEVGGRKTFGRDLLKFKRIVRKVRVYRLGVALLYKKLKSNEIHLSFFIDDARQEAIENAFEVAGGPKKMGFVKSLSISTSAFEVRRHIGIDKEISAIDLAEIHDVRNRVSACRLRYTVALGRMKFGSADREEKSANSAAAQQSAFELADAEATIRKFPARPAAPYEIVEHLQQALEQCRHRLVISSKNVDKSFVAPPTLKQIEKLLAKKVEITINITDSAADKNAGIELEKIGKKYPNLKLNTSRRSPFFYLICDDKFAVITNRPFLSNTNKARVFQHVVGYILQAPELISKYTERALSSALKPEVIIKKARISGPKGRSLK